MNSHYLDSKSPPDRSESWSALLASGFWLRVGFIGASVLVIALIMLFNGEASPVDALMGMVAGGVIAASAWRRSWVILSRVDESPTAPESDAPTPVFGKTAQSALLR